MTDRWRPLALWLVAVALTWLALRLVDVVGAAWGPYVLVAGGVTYLGVVSVMLVGTRRWSARGLGLLSALLVDCYLFGRWLGAVTLGWLDPPTRTERELAWALFAVGAALLAWGVIDWWRERLDDPANHEA